MAVVMVSAVTMVVDVDVVMMAETETGRLSEASCGFGDCWTIICGWPSGGDGRAVVAMAGCMAVSMVEVREEAGMTVAGMELSAEPMMAVVAMEAAIGSVDEAAGFGDCWTIICG